MYVGTADVVTLASSCGRSISTVKMVLPSSFNQEPFSAMGPSAREVQVLRRNP